MMLITLKETGAVDGSVVDEDNVGYISSKNKPKEEPGDSKAKGSFLYAGGSEWNNNNFPESQSTDSQTPQIPIEKKVSCWNCFKLFPQSQELNAFGKIFCSQKCKDI